MQRNLEQLRNDFDAARKVTEAFSASQDETADEQFVDARKRLAELREQLVSPLEKKLHLKEQYEFQKQILADNGFLETLANGELGIVDKDGNEYPFPTYQEIRKRVRENKEMLETKIEQGFTEFVITPFALPLDVLKEKLGKAILKHFEEKKLLASDGTELNLNADEPFWMWDCYQNKEIVYEPESIGFDEPTDTCSHTGGKTKEQLLSENGGYRLSFLENLPDLPAEGKGKEIGNRKQLEANQSPIDYLKLLQTDIQYQFESGLTPEDWMAYFLSHLEKTNTVTDDFAGKGKLCWNIGAYFPEDEYVPFSYWYRDYRHAYAGRLDAWYADYSVGVRCRVGI